MCSRAWPPIGGCWSAESMESSRRYVSGYIIVSGANGRRRGKMQDYQPHKNNPYYLPTTLYRRVLVMVRDYDRMVTEYKEIVHETTSGDGQPRSSSPGDPVEHKIERMDRLWQDIRSIEMALIRVPPEYRQGVLKNIQSGGWPMDVPAHPNTWSKWRRRFLFWTAKNLKLI